MTHRQGHHAVIIDDDVLLSKYFERQFQRSGYQLHMAAAGREGLILVRDVHPDVVLLDVHLPDMDGVDLCRELKGDSSTAHIPVIFMTSSPDAYVGAFQAGAADCITKPIRSVELQARVAHVLQAHHVINQGAIVSQDEGQWGSGSEGDAHHRAAQAVANLHETLGVMGHELRTPLAGLRAMSEHLLTERISGTQPHSFVQAIHTETVRLSGMVDNMLEAARINSGLARWKWTTVSLQSVCEGAIRTVAPLVDGNIRVVSDVHPSSLSMLGDADSIHRLVLNLLSNSLKHTVRGTISVHARCGIEIEDEWIELTVADTGAGIPRQAREKLGVPFALNWGPVRESVGAGLGISICESIIAAHGGHMEFWSRERQGTVVTVRMRSNLPRPLLSDRQYDAMEAAA